VKECIEEAFLNRVLGVLTISCNAISNAQHLFRMTFVQIIEGTSVTVLRGCHTRLVTHNNHSRG
jgi:hypothetical protein